MEKQFEILEKLIEKESAILALIVRKTGSTPRSPGTFMLITKDKIYGTISGGVEEYQAIKKARSLIDEKKSELIHYTVDNKKAGDLGMVCGGENDVYFRYFDKKDYKLVKEINEKINNNDNLTLIYDIETSNIEITEDEKIKNKLVDDRYFYLNLKQKGRVYVFGAGHVSQALVPVLIYLGFDVTVIDDRKEFLSEDKFPSKVTLKNLDFKNMDIEITNSDYCVIMTRGHKYDEICIRYSLKNANPRYIGCMGSSKKANLVKENLLKDNYNIENLYLPVGIDINSETPEEIAISVAAQMIKIKNGDW